LSLIAPFEEHSAGVLRQQLKANHHGKITLKNTGTVFSILHNLLKIQQARQAMIAIIRAFE